MKQGKRKLSQKAAIIEAVGDGTYQTRNQELERQVLKSLFSRPEKIGLIATTLSSEHFADPRFGDIYIKAVELYKKGRMRKSDTATVLAECLRNPIDEIEPDDYRAAIGEISRESIDTDVDHAIQVLNNLRIARQLMALSHEVIGRAATGEDISDLVSDASNRLRGLSSSFIDSDTLEDLDDILARQPSGARSIIEPVSNGLLTPFPPLNEMTGGLAPGDITVIAGRPGTGKSALLVQILYHISSLSNDIVLYSHEMEAETIWKRIMCAQCDVMNDDVKMLNLTAKEKERSEEFLFHNPAKPHLLISYRGGKTPAKIRTDIIKRQDKTGKKVALIAVDFLQLMYSGMNKVNKNEEVSLISRSMKEIAQEFNVPVILLSSMNREYERRQGKDVRPILSDLNESGQIESDASVVLFTHRPKHTNPNTDPPDDELIVEKNRDGRKGIIKARYNGPYFRFDLPPQRM